MFGRRHTIAVVTVLLATACPVVARAEVPPPSTGGVSKVFTSQFDFIDFPQATTPPGPVYTNGYVPFGPNGLTTDLMEISNGTFRLPDPVFDQNLHATADADARDYLFVAGRYVLFGASEAGLLRRLDSTTGTIVPVLKLGSTFEGTRIDSAWDATMSSDGRFVVFRTNKTAQSGALLNKCLLVDVAVGTTKAAVPLQDGAGRERPCYDPQISGDGRYLVFDDGSKDLYRRDLVTGAEVHITHDALSARLPGISSDGRFVLWGDHRWDATNGAISTFADLPAQAVVPEFDFLPDRNLAFSPDGNLVAYKHAIETTIGGGTFPGPDQIFVKNLTTGTVRMVSAATNGEPGNAASARFRFSTDGRVLTFVSTATNLPGVPTSGNPTIYRWNVDSTGTTSAGKNDSRNVPPGFSVDSNWWDWPDSDKDGIPNYWETHGVWVNGKFLDLPARGASPTRKDLFIHYDFARGEELSQGVFTNMQNTFAGSPFDGTSGIALHIERGSSVDPGLIGQFELTPANIARVREASGFSSSPEAGGGGVPQLYKWMLNFKYDPDAVCDGTRQDIGCSKIKGFSAWTADNDSKLAAVGSIFPPTLPGTAQDFARASNATHELGHLLGLAHHGAENTPTTDPAYKSVMTYAYSHFGISGLFKKNSIDYSRTTAINLDWSLGPQVGKLTFVPGQYGEDPGFYTEQGDVVAHESQPSPRELSLDAGIAEAAPDAVRGFFSSFGIDAHPDIPAKRFAT
jgi:WD40-like Beta Propeller Repeat